MIKIGKEHHAYAFDKAETPVERATLPAHLLFETQDAFNGQIRKTTDVLENVDMSIMNPITGPVFLEGVHPGDVLEIKIKRIDVAEEGFALCVPGEGLLGHLVKEPKTKIFPVKNRKVAFGDGKELPIHPMIGVIGVAPAEGTPLAMIPGNHGGNMDTRYICESATLYLPVQVEGGLLSMGDLHAVQGDGESFYTGLEISGEVELEVNVRRDFHIDIPFVCCDGKLASIATAETTDGALRLAMEKLVDFVAAMGNMDFYEAGFFCGLYANLEISQVVDPLKTARMTVELERLKEIGLQL